MTQQLWAAARALLALTLVLGVAYPLVITVVALAMPHQAQGSPLRVDGREVGSSLIGQAANGPEWFQPRPSASGYAGDASGGTNWGPSAPELRSTLATRERELQTANPDAPAGPVPADALTASASGLDPHISPAYARWQAPRVASARGIPVEEVHRLIDASTTHSELGYLGADRVDVAQLNLALATRAPLRR